MHDCPLCGSYCDCDGEDLHQPPPDDCLCARTCDDEPYPDEYEWDGGQEG